MHKAMGEHSSVLALNMGTARGALSKTAVQLCEHLPDYP